MPDANNDSSTAFEETGSSSQETGLIPAETTLPDANQATDSGTQTDNEQSQEDRNQGSDSEPSEPQDGGLPVAIEEPLIKSGFPAAVDMGSTHCPEQQQPVDENSVGIEGYTSNVMLCSNRPTGQYCTDWEASCSQTTWAYPYTNFYIYMRVYDIFHSNRYDYSVRIDADDPSGNDVQWWDGSQYVDYLEYKYNGTGTWSYLCNQFWVYLTTHTGQWRLKFRLHDYLDGTNYYFYKNITIKCDSDSHCSAGQACRNNNCVTCNSHAYYKCYNDDLYWYDSCDRREEMKEDCRVSCEWNSTDGYYCSNGMKVNWNVYAFDLWRNGKPNATVQYDLRDGEGWQFGGQTNSSGNLQFTKILVWSGGRALDTRVISAEGALCEERYNFFERENDTDTYFFLCPEANLDNQLHITMSTNKKEYPQEEQIQFSFNVKDNAANNVQGTFIGLILPDGSTATAPATNASGNSTYSMTAAGEGVQKFTAIATKTEYKNASTETSVTVKEKPKTIVEVVGTNKQPIPGATIFVNGAPSATTGPTGKATITTPPGTHEIEVENPYGGSCGTRYLQEKESSVFSCKEKGSLVIRVRTADKKQAIANVYVFLDDIEQGITNPTGALFMEDVLYGQHKVDVYLKIKVHEEDPDYSVLQGTKYVTVNSDYQLYDFEVAPGGVTGLEIDRNNPNLVFLSTKISPQFPPAVVLVAYVIGGFMVGYGTAAGVSQGFNWGSECAGRYIKTGVWLPECYEKTFWVAVDVILSSPGAVSKIVGTTYDVAGKPVVTFLGNTVGQSRYFVPVKNFVHFFISKINILFTKFAQLVGWKAISIFDDIAARYGDDVALRVSQIASGVEWDDYSRLALAEAIKKTSISDPLINNINELKNIKGISRYTQWVGSSLDDGLKYEATVNKKLLQSGYNIGEITKPYGAYEFDSLFTTPTGKKVVAEIKHGNVRNLIEYNPTLPGGVKFNDATLKQFNAYKSFAISNNLDEVWLISKEAVPSDIKNYIERIYGGVKVVLEGEI